MPWSARRGEFFPWVFGAEVKKNGRFQKPGPSLVVQLIEEGILRNSFTEKRWWFSQGEGNYSRAGLKCLFEDFGTFAILTQGYWRERGKHKSRTVQNKVLKVIFQPETPKWVDNRKKKVRQKEVDGLDFGNLKSKQIWSS